MKGIILAGGSATRLYPATICLNKHLLPIYNKPMIYYPLSILMLAGIREVLLISSPRDIEGFRGIFGTGERLGLKFSYAVQPRPNGLAEALIIGEDFIKGDSVCLILGDNIFFGHGLPALLRETVRSMKNQGGAYVFASNVQDPERYGIVEFDSKGVAVSIEEKPKRPKSNWAVTGLYFFDRNAPEIAHAVKPSGRGELEITSVNAKYLGKGALHVKPIGRGFAWFDAGTHDSFLEASKFIATIETRTGYMVGCIEEIAYAKGWITKEALLEIAETLKKTDYGKYLIRAVGGEE
ncbi:MAG: glucose-1-phosphate thymidylyltransferase RfbA [Nitrospiraceae bacterium]|nr:glucose-1-phosphate thymidylyltransferase RfbA [Nitrospiraceae bacterium]